MIQYALFDPETHRFRIETTTEPEPCGGEAVVRVSACTLCGSDLHSISGRRSTESEMVLGHEALGTIQAVGDPAPTAFDGQSLQVGDRVTWSVIAACGECWNCQRGIGRKCTHLRKYGHWPAEDSPLSGGLAEAILLTKGTSIFKVPAAIDDWAACPANCATATCMAAFDAVDLKDSVVAIIGAGLLGLTATAIAQYRGAKAVCVADLDEHRATLSRKFGAAQVAFGASWPDQLEAFVDQCSQGRGADVVLEMTGIPSATEVAIDQASVGGQIGLVGAVYPGPPLALDAETVVRRLLRLYGVHNYEPRHLQQALEFLNDTTDKFPFAELVQVFDGLESIERGVDAAKKHSAIRIGIRPSSAPLTALS